MHEVKYCGITYFHACLIFAYFALWPMREFKTSRKVSLNVIFLPQSAVISIAAGLNSAFRRMREFKTARNGLLSAFREI